MEKEWLRRLEKIQPVQKYAVENTVFLIYKAKDLYNPKWNSGLLKKITIEARKSYLRYGKVPLLDSYDKNAAIYLCRAIDSRSEEWLSLRFIPGQTGASPLEDLGQYICKDEPIAKSISKKLLPGVKNFESKLVAISRICGISPYLQSQPEAKNHLLPLRYTGKSFILINKVFFSSSNFTYLIGVFRRELLQKLLVFNQNTSVRLPAAHKVLGCSSGDIRLNRDLLANQFPGYFLNVYQIIDLLESLVKQGSLSIQTIKRFVKLYDSNLKNKVKGKRYGEILKMLQGLNKLLLISGRIPNSKMTGDDLRDLVARHVDDGPDLRIATVAHWQKQLKAIKI